MRHRHIVISYRLLRVPGQKNRFNPLLRSKSTADASDGAHLSVRRRLSRRRESSESSTILGRMNGSHQDRRRVGRPRRKFR